LFKKRKEGRSKEKYLDQSTFSKRGVTGQMTIYKDVDEQEEDRMQTRSRRQETDLLQVVMFYSCGL